MFPPGTRRPSHGRGGRREGCEPCLCRGRRGFRFSCRNHKYGEETPDYPQSTAVRPNPFPEPPGKDTRAPQGREPADTRPQAPALPGYIPSLRF